MTSESVDRFERVGELFRALASPVRIAIVHLLVERNRHVHELAEATDLPQPLISQHLRVLRGTGLIHRVRTGRGFAYALRDHRIGRIVADAIAHTEEGDSTMTTATEHREHAGHDHTHGDGCGHASVQHADHTDYLHDGHAHHTHGEHYDECTLDQHVPAEEHAHAHGDDCGHERVSHGDHVDFVHDGHRHAAHDDHYDEH